MTKEIDYYISLNSPWTYLGSRRLEEIARTHRADVRVKPVDFATIFPTTGGLPLAKRAPERQAYRLVELARWREVRDLPLNLHPKFFPAPELAAACAVIAAGEAGGDPLGLAHAILRAVWAEERDIADPGTLEALVSETGHHGLDIISGAEHDDTKRRYRDLTAEALAAGVFGAPTYVYAGEMFWGQDRIEFLDRALAH